MLEDFFGGIFNRFLFFTGARKALLPNPRSVNREAIAHIKGAPQDHHGQSAVLCGMDYRRKTDMGRCQSRFILSRKRLR